VQVHACSAIITLDAGQQSVMLMQASALLCVVLMGGSLVDATGMLCGVSHATIHTCHNSHVTRHTSHVTPLEMQLHVRVGKNGMRALQRLRQLQRLHWQRCGCVFHLQVCFLIHPPTLLRRSVKQWAVDTARVSSTTERSMSAAWSSAAAAWVT
jgi:hypothetical protein